jgi:hypothetical protein
MRGDPRKSDSPTFEEDSPDEASRMNFPPDEGDTERRARSSPVARGERELLQAIKEDYRAFKYAPYHFQKDKDFVLTAISLNPRAWQFADDTLQFDRDVLLAAVERDGSIFADAKRKEESDYDRIDSDPIYYRKTKEYEIRIQRHNKIYGIMKTFEPGDEIILAALRNNPNALKFMPFIRWVEEGTPPMDELLGSELYCLQFVGPRSPNNTRENKDIVRRALRYDYRMFTYADKKLLKDFMFVRSLLDEFGAEKVREMFLHWCPWSWCNIGQKLFDEVFEKIEQFELAKVATKDRPGRARPVSPTRVRDLGRMLRTVAGRPEPDLEESASSAAAAIRLPEPKIQDMPEKVLRKIGYTLTGKGGRKLRRQTFKRRVKKTLRLKN